MKPTLLWLLVTGVLVPACSLALPQVSSNTAYPQEVYSARDLRFYNPQTLYDLLRHLPGVTLGQQSNGKTEIQLHGLDSSYLTILINGQPLLGDRENNILSTRQIPAAMIDHILIDRNPRADLIQSGSAGTINVVLSDAYGGDGLLLSAGGQPLSSRQAFAAHLSGDKHPLRLFGEHRLHRYNTHGDTDTEDGNHGSWESSQREQSESLHLSYNTLLQNRHPLSLYLLQSEHEHTENLDGVYALNRPDIQSAPVFSDVHSQQQGERRNQRAGGNLIINWRHLSLETSFVAEQFSLDHQLRQQTPEAAWQRSDIDDSRYQLGAQLRETVAEHRWSAGLSFEQRKRIATGSGSAILTTNSDRSGLPYNYDVKENRIGLHLLDRWQVTDSTHFEAGFRMESHEVSLDSFSGSEASGIDTSTYWLPSFHLMHRLTNQSRVRISVSQSVKEPEISEQVPYEFRQGNIIWRGNDALEAELISNFDLSYEYNFMRQASARTDRNSGLYIRAFQRIINRAIYQGISTETSTPSPLTVLTSQNNEGNSILRGVELDVEFYPGIEDMRIDIGAGAYHSEMQTDGLLNQRYQLPNQPGYMVRLAFIHQPLAGLRYGGNWRYQDGSDRFLPDESGYLVQSSSPRQNLDIFVEFQWSSYWYSLANLSLTPGPPAWQEQSGIRQYRDVQPQWQLALMRAF
ncbi:MAG: hypothetical protein CMI02_00380 [Oceanospirillaceae bacterium]|nr:hypothetical protein [Oceanospirillaceae bacterium]MBT10474.1 hypothetical protein [Oceanospirillaceae bacterium]|tara:strand:+ start:46775 stop:48832 length:2058 start_codon:yes stop_codon:yes gene_type:complete